MDTAARLRYATEDRIGVLEELLNERYSVRAFLPQEVPRETIEQVLKVAQRTASWCRRVVCGISFGFADHAHKVNSYRTSRASVADTATFVDE